MYLSGGRPRGFILMAECVASFVIIKRLSRVNVIGLLCRLQVKIENICLFKIIIKKHENIFKNWLCPNSLLLPNKSELPPIFFFGGGCSSPRPPPGPYAYDHKAILSEECCTNCIVRNYMVIKWLVLSAVAKKLCLW